LKLTAIFKLQRMQISVRNIAELHSGIYTNISSFRGESVYYLQIRHWDKERKWAEYIEPELREDRRLMKNYGRCPLCGAV
jgi:hypothetical protein